MHIDKGLKARGASWLKKALKTPEVEKAISKALEATEKQPADSVDAALLKKMGGGPKLDVESLLSAVTKVVGPDFLTAIAQSLSDADLESLKNSDFMASLAENKDLLKQAGSALEQLKIPGMASILGLDIGDIDFSKGDNGTKEVRFQGSWEDYKSAIDAHNKAIDDAYDAPGSHEEKMERAMAVPAMVAPPVLPQKEALQTWNFRFPDSGKLLTAPGATQTPETQKIHLGAKQLLGRLMGTLDEPPENLELHLYSGNSPAFTSVTDSAWKGEGRVKHQPAQLKAALTTLYPESSKLTEIGLPVGILENTETEGELAFVLARQLANATKIGPSATALDSKKAMIALKSPANTLKADAEAFHILIKAGFDPTEGLNFLARTSGAGLLVDTDDKSAAGRAFAGNTPDQGPRLAAAQAVVEVLRRSNPEAMPGRESKAISPEMKQSGQSILAEGEVQAELATRYQTSVDDYITQRLEATEDKERYQLHVPEDFKQRLNSKNQNVGRALTSALPLIENSDLTSQEKVDTALFSLLTLDRGSKTVERRIVNYVSGQEQPEQLELPKEFGEFLSRHTNDGSWSAETFTAKLEAQGHPAMAKRAFLKNLLMNPSFQRSISPLYENNSEWKSLVKEAGPMAAEPGKLGDPREDFINILGDLNRPTDVEARPLDAVLQDSMVKAAGEQLQTKGWNYTWVLTKAQTALEGNSDFSQRTLQALQPAAEINEQRNAEDLNIAFEDLKATQRLFSAGQELNRTDAERELLKKQFLAADEPQIPHRPAAELERLLDSFLADPELTEAEQDKTIRALLDLTPPYGDRERTDFNPETLEPESVIVELPNLTKKLQSFSPQRLVGMIEDEVAKRDGVETKPGIMADFFEKSHRVPTLSFFGRDEKLRESAASAMTLPLLDQSLAVFEGLDELETGTSRFLTESLMAIEKKGMEFDGFLSRYKSVARAERFVGEPELRKELSKTLTAGLKEMKPSEINKELGEKALKRVLTMSDKADLLATLINPKEKGSTEQLAEAVKQVEKDHKLNKGKPALRKAFRELVAERFKLQPTQLNQVFPQVADDISRQLDHFNLQVRGLSSLTAVTRRQSPQEQMKMLDYMLGRRAEMPEFLARLSEEASSTLGLGKAPSKVATDLRDSLDTAESKVRSMVVASFVSGPDGLLATPDGRKVLVDRFMEPIKGPQKELARDLADVLIESQGTQAGLSIGYLLSARQKQNGLTEGQVLNRLFDSYGTPGIKLKQYLAFTSEFEKYKKAFEHSQDSALPLSYLEVVKLADHHYGDKWRDNWKLTKILGSGSVNVAVQVYDEHSGEHRVLSLPRKSVKTNSDYDFYRVNEFVDRLLSDPEKVETFGYLKGLVNTIRDSVSLEFDRKAVYRMSNGVEEFYNRKVDGWQVKTVGVYSLQGRAIEMDQAQGKTARKVLNKNPEAYNEAMKAIAKVERDALFGMAQKNDPTPTTLHANPDVHDGQVLIDEESKTVTILDFGQAANIDNEGREYGADLLTIVGGAYKPKKAAEILERHSGVSIDPEKLEVILDSKKRMDVFTKLLGTLSMNGGKVPIPVVHWVLGMNRQIALAEKTGDSMMNTLRALAIVRKTGGDMETFNALRVAKRTPGQVLKGGILGPVGGWMLSWLPFVD